MNERRRRESFSKFAQEQASPEYQKTLGRLNKLWKEWNEEYFAAEMVVPYIMFAQPRHPSALGAYSRVTSFGGKAEIKLRPSLIWGGHPLVRSGKRFAEGRFLLVADVLLHEMIHQWQHEVVENLETTQAGHGPLFRDKCNEISEALKLPKVRAGKARGRDKDLPSCAQWPHNARPEKYYCGAVIWSREMTPVGRLCRAAREFAKDTSSKSAMAELFEAAVNYGKER